MTKQTISRRSAFLLGVAAQGSSDSKLYLDRARRSADPRQAFRWALFGVLTVFVICMVLFVATGAALAHRQWGMAAVLFVLGVTWQFAVPAWAVKLHSNQYSKGLP